MNTVCYAVIFIDKKTLRSKQVGLYSEGPMTLTYEHEHEAAAELFRIERSTFEEAYGDAVIMLSMRFEWAYSLMGNELIDDVVEVVAKDSQQVTNQRLDRDR